MNLVVDETSAMKSYPADAAAAIIVVRSTRLGEMKTLLPGVLKGGTAVTQEDKIIGRDCGMLESNTYLPNPHARTHTKFRLFIAFLYLYNI